MPSLPMKLTDTGFCSRSKHFVYSFCRSLYITNTKTIKMAGAFEPRKIVNGNMLRTHVGQNVSIMLCVEDEAGTNLTGSSTDNQKISVSLTDSVGAVKGDWIEVIGKVLGASAIRGSEAILFGGENIDLDTEAYNMLVSFMNNCKEIYRNG